MNEKSTKEYWDNRAKIGQTDINLVYEDVIAFKNSTLIVNKLLDMFPGSMLDIGCGYGRFYKQDREYFGIDFSEEMINKAKKRFPNGNFKVADWKDDLGTFDVVLESICLSAFNGSLNEFKKLLLKHVNSNGILILVEAKEIQLIAKDNLFKYESRS